MSPGVTSTHLLNICRDCDSVTSLSSLFHVSFCYRAGGEPRSLLSASLRSLLSCSCPWAGIDRDRTSGPRGHPSSLGCREEAEGKWQCQAEGAGAPGRSLSSPAKAELLWSCMQGRQPARQLDCHGRDSVWPFLKEKLAGFMWGNGHGTPGADMV